MKKLLISLYLIAFSVGFSCSQLNKPKGVNSVVVDGERIPLRQYANQDTKGINAKKANSGNNDPAPEVANIETTNVDYDLRYIFGGEDHYLDFNIETLKPKEGESPDTSYKFICAKPVNENLYLYVYHANNELKDLVSYANFTISLSTTHNDETGLFEEKFEVKKARFINSYGLRDRFMKFAIDNVINLDYNARCYIKDFNITYERVNGSTYSTSLFSADNEFAIMPNGNDDFVTKYWTNEYVRITQGSTKLLLTGKTRPNDLFGAHNFYNSYDENFYYFFNSDHEIQQLMEVQYDYDYLTYIAETRFTEGINDLDFYKKLEYPCFSGSLEMEEVEKVFKANSVKFHYDVNKDIEPVRNVKVKADSYVVDVERHDFLWWNKTVQYKVNTIVNCLDLDNELPDKEQEQLKLFIQSVQNEQAKNNKPKYQWAFRVKFDTRKTIDSGVNGWWWWEKNYWVNSQCHEIFNTMIVWLKFKTNNQVFEFNVHDIPRQLDEVYLGYVPYETLLDEVWNNTKNAFDLFGDIFNKIFDNIVPIAIIVISIILLVICYPLLSSTALIFKATTESIVVGINKKNKKKMNEIESEEIKKNE